VRPGDLEGTFDVGDHELHVECRGLGTPTVLFHNGAGSNHHEWDPIYEAVAATTRACRYDLPNTGQSGPLERVRTVADDVADLHELERQGILAPPYVMVSFSAGALPAWRYAMAHPDDVVGMVLTDPLLPGYDGAWAARLPDAERPAYEAQRAGDNPLRYDFTASQALLGDPPTLGATPTVIIANDRHIRWEQCPDCEDLTPVAQGLINALVERAADARAIRVTSPHWVTGTHPDLVRDEVLAMVERAR